MDKSWEYISKNMTGIRLLIEDGASEKQIAEYLGVAVGTINKWKSKYPTFRAVFQVGREVVVDKLKGKLYMEAMGFVDRDITHTKTKRITRPELDEFDGEMHEVTVEETYEVNDKYRGFDRPNLRAIEMLLRAYAPDEFGEKLGLQATFEPVQIVDDIPNLPIPDEPKLFYDDSVDENSEDGE
jgi:hypothetical protein